jgi:hypothetical protein
MGLDSESRRRKLTAVTKHNLLDPEKYGRLLYLKHKDTIDRMFISHGFFPTEEEAEKFCADLFSQTWKSIGRAIKFDIEVRVGDTSKLKNQLFTIKYARRDK